MPDMLHAHADSQPIAAWGRTPWMPFALAELGQREIFGAKDNPRIQAYYAAVVGVVIHSATSASVGVTTACPLAHAMRAPVKLGLPFRLLGWRARRHRRRLYRRALRARLR